MAYIPVADLHSKILDASPPGPNFFQFHAVFGKMWQNRMLASPRRVGAPTSRKSWIHHWIPPIPIHSATPAKLLTCMNKSFLFQLFKFIGG